MKQALYYCPALRMKGGELIGLRDLASDVADRVLPRLIVPPPADRDNDLQAQLFATESFPDISASLSGHWRRPVLVDAAYLLDEFGRDRMGIWLPKMFEKARRSDSRPIPLVSIDDLVVGDLAAYRSSVDSGADLKFGIVMSSGQVTDAELVKRALGSLAAMGLQADDCLIISDFHDSDFSSPDVVAPIIGEVLQTLQAAGRWQQIAFQGTNFPDHNPADADSYSMVPRNEWIAWCRAVAFDRDTAQHMIFGDYAADCSKMNFGASGGAAIRHYRYATPNAWLVQRGAAEGSHMRAMRAVCEAIVASGSFAGQDFSVADEHIYDMARGMGRCGAAREWRATNTAHHITRVVVDIGQIRGAPIGRKQIHATPEQMSLLTK